MNRIKLLAMAVALLAPAAATLAVEQPLICFGNEPFWSLDLTTPGQARFSLPDGPATTYRGRETRLEPRRESVWRGRSGGKRGGELVAFLRDSACSDGMSDIVHPVSVNVSLPGGAHYAGCCRVPAAPAPAAMFEGGDWRLTALPGQPLPAADARNAPSARFEGGRVHGFSGCNQFTGQYTVDRDKLTIGLLAGTMMACPEPAMSLDNAFRKAFAGTLQAGISGNRLTLTPAGGGKPLQFERAPKPTLEGVQWEATGYNNGRQAVVSPQIGTRLTVVFKGTTVSGSSGCNTFHGPFRVDGNALSIGPLATTRKLCSGEGVMAQEREFIAALESATSWDIVRGMLDVHRGDGERVLTASAAGKK